MKIILITAYDVNPYKGSESGMGWNFISQAMKYNKIIAITRENNRKSIEKFINEHKINTVNLEFLYYDLPYYLRFWKKGQRGSSLYFYLWQMFMPVFIKKQKLVFDIAHNLNFHTDAFPSFLWLFNKPLIWGPINHHEKIPYKYILNIYGIKAFLKDRAIWIIKQFLWTFDPFLKITKYKAKKILGGSKAVKKRLHLNDKNFILYSSVGSENVDYREKKKQKNFNIISIGRFIPLKGFDITINAFVKFINENKDINNVTLTLIGKGPEEEFLRKLADRAYDKSKIQFINWTDRDKLTKYYQKSSIFLFPSHEGAGMVVMEAMSYGLPILCFDNYGPGELIGDDSGIKIPYTNYTDSITHFSDAIKKLYYDKFFYNKLSFNAKKRSEKYYLWNEKGKVLRNIYSEIN